MNTSTKSLTHKIFILIFMITILVVQMLSVLPSVSATPTDEYSFQISDVNNSGEFNDIRFWERLNKMQYYATPTYQYYYDGEQEKLNPRLSYTPISMSGYVVNPMTLNDIDIDDQANLDSIVNIWTYSANGEATGAPDGAVVINELTNDGKAYTGHIKYTVNASVAQIADDSYRVLLVGDTYSWKETYTFGGLTNDVDIYGLKITNPSDSGGPAVVYFNGVMYYADYANSGNEPRSGAVEINNYVILNPGYSVVVDESLIEGDTGNIYPMCTRYSGSIMVRYGVGMTKPVEFYEQFNDYFSYCYSFSDSDFVGLENGSDGRNGGSNIVNSWAMQQYYDQNILPDLGQLKIESNGYYSTRQYSSVLVDVEQNITWGGMFDWIFDSIGAFMGFEIAPGWTIGVIMSIIVGLAIAIWAIRVFMGG